jgi:uncharacterized protein YkwD
MQDARWTIRWALVGVLAVLSACGGGGDAPAPSPASAPAPGPSPAPAPTATAESTCGLSDFVVRAMARINQWRATGATCGSRGAFAPATALVWNDLLTQAADGHSRDMVANNFFDHVGSDGSTLGSRVTATGYAWRSLGENIAAGQITIEQVVDGWIASEGHCANLLNPAFAEVGLACVSGTTSTTYRTYWTMDLGQPR